MKNLLKKLIFAKEQQHVQAKWTIENNGHEASATRYDQMIASLRGAK
ncbi:hypothetical protein Javan273_0043 [Streptococcus phage Javan273]|nr:hypothetical protein Javan273_0043 [Streptococcus phage Javan273]